MSRDSRKGRGSAFLDGLSGPPPPSWSDAALHHGARLLLLVGLAAMATLLFPPEERLDVPRYEVGEVASEDVIAQIAFGVPKTPAKLAEEQEEAAKLVPPTFDARPEAADTTEARLERFFTRLDSARAQGREAVRRVGGPEITLSDAQLDILMDPEQTERLRRAALQSVRMDLPRGVMETSQHEEVITDEVVVVDSDGRERTVPKDQILTARAFYEGAVSRLDGATPALEDLTRLVLLQHIDYTYEPNVQATEFKREQARQSVQRTSGWVQQNEAIVRQNDQIGPDDLDKLEAYYEQLETRGLLEREGVDLIRYLGMGFLNVLIFGVYALLVVLFRSEVYSEYRWLLLHAILIAVYLGSGAVIERNGLPPEFLPVAFSALPVAVLWDSRMALVLAMTLAAITGVQAPFAEYPIVLTVLVGGAAAALGVRAVRRRAQTWIFIAIIAASYAAVLVALALSGLQEPADLPVRLAAAGANAVVSGILAMGFLTVFEWFTGITTDQTLLEWADPNRNLLRRLAREAPGTYAHTINVANLAEAGANAIGANGLLCRVGTYYHDVGKMLKPQYFVENQPPGVNPHDKLKPETSAQIVREHVIEGLKLAREEKVPEVIAAFIPEHHGTQGIGFFYEKAQEEGGEPTIRREDLPEQFRYPGPRPHSKETAITMLADSVESAARALQDPTPERIRDLVGSIVDSKIAAGQLDEAPLTLAEVAELKEQFTKVLAGMYHHRLDYPQTKHLTDREGSAAEGATGQAANESGAGEAAPGGAGGAKGPAVTGDDGSA